MKYIKIPETKSVSDNDDIIDPISDADSAASVFPAISSIKWMYSLNIPISMLSANFFMMFITITENQQQMAYTSLNELSPLIFVLICELAN
jgi:hypothetical protein